MRLILLTLSLGVILFGPSRESQARPNFSGTWIKLTDGPAMVNLGGVVAEPDMTISQDATSIKIERAYGAGRAVMTISLNGAESPNRPVPRVGAAPKQLVSKATWEGDSLRISTARTMNPEAAVPTKIVTIEALSLEGGNLIVERTDEALGMRSGPPRSGMLNHRKIIYKKR